MSELYVGLMSGTSMDGIDAALVDFSSQPPCVLDTHYQPYSASLRTKILHLCQPGLNEIDRLAELDNILGEKFALAARDLLHKNSHLSDKVKAIGSHGQTIRHYPKYFSLQIGDPNIIATITGVTTVADFRRRDIALGGQGAPLVPAFHQQIFSSTTQNRVVVNIGGIANITVLPKNSGEVIGFDTGPGNLLMDAWINKHQDQSHDKNGQWAASGQVNAPLLASLLEDAFFHIPGPKSTGREAFNLDWLSQHLTHLDIEIAAVDVQATLLELTANTIINAIRQCVSNGEILICGGGAHNEHLMLRLAELAQPHFIVDSTLKYGVHPDWLEAVAFAWLARQTLMQQTGNLPGVTGAKLSAILGGVYYA